MLCRLRIDRHFQLLSSHMRFLLCPCRLGGAFCLDIWSWRELLACQARLYPSMSSADLVHRYTCFGGSVRYVLVKSEYSFENDLVPRVSFAKVEPLLRLDLACLDDDISHMLMHIRVRCLPWW